MNMDLLITIQLKLVQLIKESPFMVYLYLGIGEVDLIYLKSFLMLGQHQVDSFQHFIKNVSFYFIQSINSLNCLK